ncbi:MAG: hypothetical protein IRY99_11145 [Isosphaeraceae bacterium]|nr:hypothetical protein [Isosphaeraceae bacterium]
MEPTRVLFAYFGPETMLPVSSVLAGAAGVALMFGRNIIHWLAASGRALNRRPGREGRAARSAPRRRRPGQVRRREQAAELKED